MFANGIKKIIETYEGRILAINCQKPVCICAKGTSGEADAFCDYCFGTGKKIIIKEIYGVAQDSNGSSTMRKAVDYTITKEIFVRAEYTLTVDDLLFFEDKIFKVYQIKTHRLSSNEPVYHIVYATPLKYDSAFIINKLKELGAT